jgi:hypothetical protein
MRQWYFVADMNLDGSVTITDVGLWMKWLFFMPGDALILASMDTAMGRFLEVTPTSYGGFGSGVVSFLVWAIGYFALADLPSRLDKIGHQGAAVVAKEPDRAAKSETRWWLRKYRYDGWIVIGSIVAFAVVFLIYAAKGWL